jgi:hypothetical protein
MSSIRRSRIDFDPGIFTVKHPFFVSTFGLDKILSSPNMAKTIKIKVTK